MTLIGSYVDHHGLVVTVSMERTRQGSYLVVKDRWRSPLVRDGATVELEFPVPGNARSWAECDVLIRGGQLSDSGEALVCASVIRSVGEEALRESRRESRTSSASCTCRPRASPTTRPARLPSAA
jgi:hypothetical protein